MRPPIAMKILVTGTAGFIGYHLAVKLLQQGVEVVGLDLINDYYDVGLKEARLLELGIDASALALQSPQQSSKYPNFRFLKVDLADHDFVVDYMQQEQFTQVVHLAAQPGVRYSIINPRAYLRSNVDAFLSVLEGCRHSKVQHLVYASTSSIYGLNASMPLHEQQATEHPVSLYAATKKANEMMAHSYSQLYNLPTTGLRFFTVYGPWGRPDMAPMLFADAILKGKPIQVFNHGEMIRDFTYVGDIVEAISRLIPLHAEPDVHWQATQPNSATSSAPYRIFNIGSAAPIHLKDFISTLEQELGKEAIKEYLPFQQGDVQATHADTHALYDLIGYRPTTRLNDGIAAFVGWYTAYYDQHTDSM